LRCSPAHPASATFGLRAFDLALRERGRIAFLGADAPPQTLVLAAERLAPALIAVAATEPGRLEAVRRELSALATPTGAITR
jgi:hypothetical protein